MICYVCMVDKDKILILMDTDTLFLQHFVEFIELSKKYVTNCRYIAKRFSGGMGSNAPNNAANVKQIFTHVCTGEIRELSD